MLKYKKELIFLALYDIATALIAAFLIVRELLATGLNHKVRIKGKTSGRLAADVILLILVCALVFVKRASFNYPYLAPCLMVVFVLVSLLSKSGLCDDGFVAAGRHVPFSDVEFYAVDREDEKGFRLRLHTFTREYVLYFAPERKEQITAVLDDNKVKFAQFVPGKERQ